DDTYWLYGSVYEKERISDYCRKRFGRVAKVSQWHDTSWVRQEFGDMRTGTGHIHVNCRNAGMAISPDWFAKTTWVTLVTQEMHIITGQDYRDYISDPDKKIPTSKITHGD
ncbi:hypothetical protein H8E77_16970, partial [bacterium]|nr:hypothetical protein [bacterium]